MRNETLKGIARRTAEAMEAHWQSCLESKLVGHTPEAQAEADRAVENYFTHLQAAPDTAPTEIILGAMEKLFSDLDALNARCGYGLLETDERELLVPQIIAAAEAAGLNVDQFEHGDPTFSFRSF